ERAGRPAPGSRPPWKRPCVRPLQNLNGCSDNHVGKRSGGQPEAYVLFTPQGYPGSCGRVFEESCMTASLRFGRVAGIPVGASWSALLIALLIAWSLGGQLLPAQVPGLAPAAYWLAGAAGAGLFLGSLLA